MVRLLAAKCDVISTDDVSEYVIAMTHMVCVISYSESAGAASCDNGLDVRRPQMRSSQHPSTIY